MAVLAGLETCGLDIKGISIDLLVSFLGVTVYMLSWGYWAD